MPNATQQYLSDTPNRLYLYVGIMESIDGHKLHRLSPDQDGYFEGIPLSVFNAKSLNGCYYNAESYYKQITDPQSVFNLRLVNGNLYGEWGHPKDASDLPRICRVDMDQVSHHFKAVYTDKDAAGNNPIIRGDLKPAGPKGSYLESSLLNPHENTSFSLRCLMTEQYDPALRAPVRTVEDLVTFDAVDTPGYMQASKRYWKPTASGQECLIPITLDMLYTKSGKRVAMEGFSDQKLLDLFGISNFDLNGKPLGTYVKGMSSYKDPYGVNRSLLHAALRGNYF